jgi:hypothetical protein
MTAGWVRGSVAVPVQGVFSSQVLVGLRLFVDLV